MEIWHRVSFNSGNRPDLFSFVQERGIASKASTVPGRTFPVVTFEICESDDRWTELRDRLTGLVDIAYTVFTPEEILSAEWVRLIPSYQTGFPYPKDTWIGTKPNMQSICAHCGLYTQRSPYQIGAEPKMGHFDFVSLNWTYVLFASHGVVDDLVERGFEGFDVWDVTISPRGTPSKLVRQLHRKGSAPPGYVADETSGTKCPRCGTIKFRPHRAGPMKFRESAFGDCSDDFFLTGDWFGDGKAGFQEFVVSRRFAEHIISNRLRGVTLQPIALV